MLDTAFQSFTSMSSKHKTGVYSITVYCLSNSSDNNSNKDSSSSNYTQSVILLTVSAENMEQIHEFNFLPAEPSANCSQSVSQPTNQPTNQSD